MAVYRSKKRTGLQLEDNLNTAAATAAEAKWKLDEIRDAAGALFGHKNSGGVRKLLRRTDPD